MACTIVELCPSVARTYKSVTLCLLGVMVQIHAIAAIGAIHKPVKDIYTRSTYFLGTPSAFKHLMYDRKGFPVDNILLRILKDHPILSRQSFLVFSLVRLLLRLKVDRTPRICLLFENTCDRRHTPDIGDFALTSNGHPSSFEIDEP